MSEEKNLIEGRTGKWEMILGLEVHAQVISEAKLFSGDSTKFGAEPNTQVSLVDAAFPGMLPVINRYCVEQAVRTGLGLKAEINLKSVFDRKNYFYADLPAGYQISQYSQPIVGKGTIILDMAGGVKRHIGITRLHLEQDAGKSVTRRLFVPSARNALRSRSLSVEFPRSIVPAIGRIVEPSIRSRHEHTIRDVLSPDCRLQLCHPAGGRHFSQAIADESEFLLRYLRHVLGQARQAQQFADCPFLLARELLQSRRHLWFDRVEL